MKSFIKTKIPHNRVISISELVQCICAMADIYQRINKTLSKLILYILYGLLLTVYTNMTSYNPLSINFVLPHAVKHIQNTFTFI